MAAVHPVSLVASVAGIQLREFVEEYVVALEVAGRSRRTIEWYRAYLDDFVAFASREGVAASLQDLSPAVARRWLLAAQATRRQPLSPNSIAGRVRTLRAFGGWLQRELQLPSHPLAGLAPPKVPDVLVPSLTTREMRTLLAAVDTRSADTTRDRAIVLLLLDTGIRLSELVAVGEHEECREIATNSAEAIEVSRA
jgi:site-specific recombinase XerC